MEICKIIQRLQWRFEDGTMLTIAVRNDCKQIDE